MDGKIEFRFSRKIWAHASPASWHFVSLPIELSKEIRDHFQWQEEGWGRMKVMAQTGDLEWETAIWFDTKMNRYILPLKAEIRKKLSLQVDDQIDVKVQI